MLKLILYAINYLSINAKKIPIFTQERGWEFLGINPLVPCVSQEWQPGL